MILFIAIAFFVAGIILAIITAVRYSKSNNTAVTENKAKVVKPYKVQGILALVCFVIAQILLWLNR